MSKYFSEEELACPCCNESHVSPEFLEKMDMARDILGKPIIVNSAYRCSLHNKAVGGSPTSSHMAGRAMDISCVDSAYRWELLASLIGAGFSRIGIGKGFIHVDDDPVKNPGRVWLY